MALKTIRWLGPLVLAASTAVHANSPVWKISGKDGELFVGGTIHLLSESDYPLPVALSDAYDLSSLLVLEADLERMQDPAVLQKMMMSMIYTDGTTLDQVLSADTFAKLRRYCEERGIPLELVTGFKPAVGMMTLTALEFQKMGLTETGVDGYFGQRAALEGKSIQYLETVEEQIEFISDLGNGREDEFVSYNLDQMERIPTLVESIKSAWRAGDTEALEKLSLDHLQANFPAIYETLVVRRNRAWLPEIEALLVTPETELVLVGALHLVGSDGLLALLREKGYTIKPH